MVRGIGGGGRAGWIVALPPGRFLTLLLVVCWVPRVALLLAVPVVQQSDFAWYATAGREIAAGHGYSQAGVLTAFWPVGWPAVLGLLFRVFGPGAWSGQVLNLGLAALACGLTWVLGRCMFGAGERQGSGREGDGSGGDAIGRFAALAVAVMPNQIGYVPLLSTEIFYEALLLAGVLLLFRDGLLSLVGAGLVFGMATLTKAQSPLIPAGLLGVYCLYRLEWRAALQAARRGAIVGVVMVAVVAPWTWRNYQVFHAVIPVSTNGGVTLLTGNNPRAKGDFTPEDPSFTSLSTRVEDQVATDREAKARAKAWILANPGRFASLLPLKAFRLWAPDGEAEWMYQSGYDGYAAHRVAFRVVRGLNQVFYVLMLGLAAPSVVLLGRRARGLVPEQVGWALFAYTTAISLVFSGQSRFHFSLIPFIAVYAAWTVAGWLKRRSPTHPALLGG